MALLSPINLHLSRTQQILQGGDQLDEMRRILLERSTTPAAQAELDRLNPAQNLQGLRPPEPQQPMYSQPYQQQPPQQQPALPYQPQPQPQQPMIPMGQQPSLNQPITPLQPQSQPPYQQMNGLNNTPMSIQPTNSNPYMMPSYYNQPIIGNMGGNQLLW
jgi:hypothetical protein